MATDEQRAETEWEVADPAAVQKQWDDHEKERGEREARAGWDRIKEPGDYTYRILPPIKGTRTPFHKVFVHHIRPLNVPKANGRPVYCPKKNDGLPCVVCEAASTLFRAGNKDSTTIAKDIASKETIIVNAVRLDSAEAMERGVRKLELKMGAYVDLHKVYSKEDLGGDFTHPETGRNVIITRVGTKMNDTEYSARVNVKPTKLANMAWLKSMHHLDQAIDKLSQEDMQAILDGKETEEDTKFPPDEEKAPAAKASGRKDDEPYDDPVTGEASTWGKVRAKYPKLPLD